MADLAPSGSAHEADFSYREWREVVVQHEALFGFAFEALETLHIIAGAERGRDQGLGFSASEDGAAVHPWEDSDFDPDLADLVEFTSIGTALVVDNLITEDALAQLLVILFQLRLVGCIVFGDLGYEFLFQGANQFVAFGFRMLGGIESIGQSAADLCFEALKVSLVKFRRRDLALRFAGLAAQLVDSGANLFDFGVAEFDCVDHGFFFNFLCAGLDHDNRVSGANDHDVEQSVAHFGVGGVGDETAGDEPNAHGTDWAEERNIGEG